MQQLLVGSHLQMANRKKRIETKSICNLFLLLSIMVQSFERSVAKIFSEILDRYHTCLTSPFHRHGGCLNSEVSSEHQQDALPGGGGHC